MAQALRDENQVTVALGYDETNDATQMFRVDPSTNRLLIEVHKVSSTVPVTRENAKHDGNHIGTDAGVSDDASTNFSNLIIDNRTGFLFVDLLDEDAAAGAILLQSGDFVLLQTGDKILKQ